MTEEQLAEIEMMKQMGLPVSFMETRKDSGKKKKVGKHQIKGAFRKLYIYCGYSLEGDQ